MGDIEFCTMEQYKHIAEVNQFGVIRMTKAFLPQLRKSKGSYQCHYICLYNRKRDMSAGTLEIKQSCKQFYIAEILQMGSVLHLKKKTIAY